MSAPFAEGRGINYKTIIFLEECFQLTMTEEDFYFYPDSCVNLSQNDNGHQFRLL